MQIRGRGRPRSSSKPRIAQADAIIAETCITLSAWGYPIGDRVGRAVAEAAATHFDRTDPNGYPLGCHSIEKIHKQYVQRTRLRDGWTFQRRRWTKKSLRDNRPKKTWTVEQWAGYLIRHGGHYDDPLRRLDEDGYAPVDFVPPGDRVLTPKAHAQVYKRQPPRIIVGTDRTARRGPTGTGTR